MPSGLNFGTGQDIVWITSKGSSPFKTHGKTQVEGMETESIDGTYRAQHTVVHQRDVNRFTQNAASLTATPYMEARTVPQQYG